MVIASCAICASALRAEIEKRDATFKADKTITWARSQGVNINRFVLAKHRANHLDNGNSKSKSGSAQTGDRMVDVGDGLRPSREKSDNIAEVTTTRDGSGSDVGAGLRPAREKPDNIIKTAESQTTIAITDNHFLDTVRDMVYQMLVDGKIELKVDSGFKAIEIKHKINEESQNEKMLLEILNEIRSEELGQKKS